MRLHSARKDIMNNEEVEIWGTHKSGYSVSSFGRIKGKRVDFLIPQEARGYFEVHIGPKTVKIHRLVWETFNGDIPNGYVINHKDFNRLNNNISNLECITFKENVIHGRENRGKTSKYKIDNENIKTKIKLEIWKIHPKYKRLISNKGRVFTLRGKVSRGNFNCGGYLRIMFYSKQKKTVENLLVHRLVYETFIGTIKEGNVINHKDGCKYNNCLDNLESVSCKENVFHASKSGLITYHQGEMNTSSKLNNLTVLDIYKRYLNGCTHREISKETNISEAQISSILSGNTWKHLFREHERYIIEEKSRREDVIRQKIYKVYELGKLGLTHREIEAITGCQCVSAVLNGLEYVKYYNEYYSKQLSHTQYENQKTQKPTILSN